MSRFTQPIALNMGMGDATGARLHSHITRMLRLFESLGGLQQMSIGPSPADDDLIKQAWEEYDWDAKCFITDLAQDLGAPLPLRRT